MDISCGFAPSAAAPDLVAAAEQLGYRRAWMYDSPALYPDVWVALSRAAERTSTIGLGPGVLVPSLRHVMVTAAATAGLAELAPGRVALGIGTGFTGRLVLGQPPCAGPRSRPTSARCGPCWPVRRCPGTAGSSR